MATLKNPSKRAIGQYPMDDRYMKWDGSDFAPYTDVTEANTLIPEARRHRGLKVNIAGAEYWYGAGIEDTDLVAFAPGGGGVEFLLARIETDDNAASLPFTDAATFISTVESLNPDITVSSYTLDDDTVEIYGDGFYVIPNNLFIYTSSIIEFESHTVRRVGTASFLGCDEMTFLSMPLCTDVGVDSFKSCIKLATVKLPSLQRIGVGGFHGCIFLTTLDFPALTHVAAQAFYSCGELYAINMPHVLYIGESGFDGTLLIDVNIPSCLYIGNSAFEGAINLVDFSADSCMRIGADSFKDCEKLETLSLSSLITIHGAALTTIAPTSWAQLTVTIPSDLSAHSQVTTIQGNGATIVTT